jgi:hypothetical protein
LLSFARRVGGILDEYGDEHPLETSFRYFVYSLRNRPTKIRLRRSGAAG